MRLKCVIVYLARDILPFVMYCVNGKPCSSLLIESTNSMVCTLNPCVPVTFPNLVGHFLLLRSLVEICLHGTFMVKFTSTTRA